MEYLPSWQTTWEDWKATHPDTLALQKGYYGIQDPYINNGYYDSNSAGVIGETYRDDRLRVKQFVIGVEVNGEAVAYPFSVLSEQPVVNDVVGDVSVLVVFNTDPASGVVFDRTLDGQTLTFEASDGLILVDLETGSTWDGMSGTALDGPLAGKTLERIKSTSSFWFGWKDFYPDTRVYGIDEE